MNRKYRLTKTENIKRVRHLGTPFAHPLVVLTKHPNECAVNRFGVIAGKSIGNAVKRNRCRRQIREILRYTLPIIEPGWDIIILARKPCAAANFNDIHKAIEQLLKRAGLITKRYANSKSS